MLEVACRDPIVSRDGRSFGIQPGKPDAHGGLAVAVGRGRLVAGRLGQACGAGVVRGHGEGTCARPGGRRVPDEVDRRSFTCPRRTIVSSKRTSGCIAARPIPDDRGGCDWPAQRAAAGDAFGRGCPGRVQAPGRARLVAHATHTPPGSCVADGQLRSHFLAGAVDRRPHARPVAAGDGSRRRGGALHLPAALPLSHLPRWGARPTDRLDHRFAPIRLALQVTADNWMEDAAARLDQLHPLGGERRLAHWKKVASRPWALSGSRVGRLGAGESRARMVSGTPAIFAQGWRPGWLNDQLTGSPWSGGLS